MADYGAAQCLVERALEVVTLLPYPESCGDDRAVVVKASLEIQATVEAETLKRWGTEGKARAMSVQTVQGAESALRACMGIDKSRALKTGTQGCICLRPDDWVIQRGIPDPEEVSSFQRGVDAFNSGEYNTALKLTRLAMGEVFDRIGHMPSNARLSSCYCVHPVTLHKKLTPTPFFVADHGLCRGTPSSPRWDRPLEWAACVQARRSQTDRLQSRSATVELGDQF